MSNEFVVVISLALLFGFLNGMRDSSSIVATMISSRTFHPRTALGFTALAEFLGPFLFGTGVAKTIGSDLIQSGTLTLIVLIACLSGAIFWSLLTWFFGIPSSSSHALAGGLLGSAVIADGIGIIKPGGLYKVLLALFSTPLLGFIIGFLVLRMIYFFAQNASPRINEFFRRGQLLTGFGLALSHGANDAQKTMGIIALSLLIAGTSAQFFVPTWVVVASSVVMSLGTLFGGWRLIRTIGAKFFKIRPVDSFSTQLSSAIVIMTSSLVGLPVSTSQVVSSAVIGVGSSERFGKVRWSVVVDILTTWLITIPASAILSAGIYWIVSKFV